MAKFKFCRGQIWKVSFDNISQNGEKKTHNTLALIIQSNLLNHNDYPTTIVVLGTRSVKRDKDYFPFRVAINKSTSKKDQIDLLIDQIRSVSNKCLIGKKQVVELNKDDLALVEKAIKLLIAT